MQNVEQLRQFATQAHRDAKDYRHMAFERPEHRVYYLKCAADREADCEFYESQIAWADRFTEFEDNLGAAQ